MFGLSQLQSLLASCALSALVGAIGVGVIVHKIDEGKYARLQVQIAAANLKAIEKAVEDQRVADRKTFDAEAAAIKKAAAQNVRTVTLIEKVPYYVTVQDDKHYPLPIGFCVLHDAAADGSNPPGEVDPATVSNDMPCEVTASEAITIIIKNYGAYNDLALRFVGLQNWILGNQNHD